MDEETKKTIAMKFINKDLKIKSSKHVKLIKSKTAMIINVLRGLPLITLAYYKISPTNITTKKTLANNFRVIVA